MAACTLPALLAAACSLAPVDLGEDRVLPQRTTITAADGTVLARLFRENRELLPLEDMPQRLIDAVLSAEDAGFFRHPAFDLRSILRAALANLRSGEIVQGGSTITQQYVKNTYFRHPSQTFERKARELRLALEVEERWTKEEILEKYLNTIYLGEGAYGVEAAAETYFGHSARRLSLREAALLAALIKSPTRYDPRTHPKAATARRNYVIGRMAALGHISADVARRAERRGLGVTPDPPRMPVAEPYFVEAVKREVLQDERLGATDSERARSLWAGGLRIESTLVPKIQGAAKRAVATTLDRPGDPSAALVAIRPSSGQIVAMVGGRNWSRSQVNLALGVQGGGSGRQPGSAFKPIVAAAAMEAGIGLGTRYDSSPAVFRLSDGSTWPVRNAEGRGYGMLPLHEAMVHSVNGVYARLGLDLGPAQMAHQARLMGVRSKLPLYPSISLGSAQVSVLDMAAAYATLANYGTSIEPTTIRQIVLPEGEVLKPQQRKVQQVVSAGNAFLLTRVLEQVIRRGTGIAAAIDRPAAGKTGTTNDYVDAWFVGYTRDLVTAVWVGYPRGSIPMLSVHGVRVSGGTFPALIWKRFMTDALAGVPPSRFLPPRDELVEVKIDPVSGLLAAPWCPGETHRMLRQLAPTRYCPSPPPAPVPVPTASRFVPRATASSPAPRVTYTRYYRTPASPRSSPIYTLPPSPRRIPPQPAPRRSSRR